MYFLKFILPFNDSTSFRPRKFSHRINESWFVCHENFNDSRLYIQDKPQSEYEALPTIYFVTASIPRPEQIPQLMRLGHTLKHVARIHWVIADSQYDCNPVLLETLKKFKIPFTLLATPMPLYFEMFFYKPKRVTGIRNALRYIRAKEIEQGVLYFGEEDYVYDLRLFNELRLTKKVSMFPTVLVDNSAVNTPILHKNKVVAFLKNWRRSRKWLTDISGFAVNLRYLSQYPNATFPYKPGSEVDYFLRMLHINLNLIEPLANNCTEILVWHVESIPNKAARLILIPAIKDRKSNIKVLYENLQKMGIGDFGSKRAISLQNFVEANEKHRNMEFFNSDYDDLIKDYNDFEDGKDQGGYKTVHYKSQSNFTSDSTENSENIIGSARDINFVTLDRRETTLSSPPTSVPYVDKKIAKSNEIPAFNSNGVEIPSDAELNSIEGSSKINSLKGLDQLNSKSLAMDFSHDRKLSDADQKSVTGLPKLSQIGNSEASPKIDLKEQRMERSSDYFNKVPYNSHAKLLNDVDQNSAGDNSPDYFSLKSKNNASNIYKRRVVRQALNEITEKNSGAFENQADENQAYESQANENHAEENQANKYHSYQIDADKEGQFMRVTETNVKPNDGCDNRVPEELLLEAAQKVSMYTEADVSTPKYQIPHDFDAFSDVPLDLETGRIINQAVRKISQQYNMKCKNLESKSQKQDFGGSYGDSSRPLLKVVGDSSGVESSSRAAKNVFYYSKVPEIRQARPRTEIFFD